MWRMILMPGEIEEKPVVAGRVHITRSFSYKLNVGNYEARDFFCSQNAECAAEDAERVSDAVYQFCRREVMRSVGDYLAEEKWRKPVKVEKTA